jgi:hypothetical protein
VNPPGNRFASSVVTNRLLVLVAALLLVLIALELRPRPVTIQAGGAVRAPHRQVRAEPALPVRVVE